MGLIRDTIAGGTSLVTGSKASTRLRPRYKSLPEDSTPPQLQQDPKRGTLPIVDSAVKGGPNQFDNVHGPRVYKRFPDYQPQRRDRGALCDIPEEQSGHQAQQYQQQHRRHLESSDVKQTASRVEIQEQRVHPKDELPRSLPRPYAQHPAQMNMTLPDPQYQPDRQPQPIEENRSRTRLFGLLPQSEQRTRGPVRNVLRRRAERRNHR